MRMRTAVHSSRKDILCRINLNFSKVSKTARQANRTIGYQGFLHAQNEAATRDSRPESNVPPLKRIGPSHSYHHGSQQQQANSKEKLHTHRVLTPIAMVLREPPAPPPTVTGPAISHGSLLDVRVHSGKCSVQERWDSSPWQALGAHVTHNE